MRGARQVGKSYLVRDFAFQNSFELLELNLEKHSELEAVFATLQLNQIIPRLESILKRDIHGNNQLLFLDEIQATPSAIAALRYFYEEMPQLMLIAAGSLLEFALSEKKFSMPVGRVEYHFLYPMDFEEYLTAEKQEWVLKKIRGFSIGEDFDDDLHKTLLEKIRIYFFLGGMPAAVSKFIQTGSKDDVNDEHEAILRTYEDDFGKYCRQSRLLSLQEVFRRVPPTIGKKVIYASLAENEKAVVTKENIDRLLKAKILISANHSDCSGIPIDSQSSSLIRKLYFLDVGLLAQKLGVRWHDVLQIKLNSLSEGILAEQFVAQHLIDFYGGTRPPNLNYWLKEGKTQNAEVDFVVQVGENIIPIEVKSGATGSLRALHQFMWKKQVRLAIKICSEKPSLRDVSHKVVTGDGVKDVRFQLLTLPFYLTKHIPRLVDQVLDGGTTRDRTSQRI